VNRAWRQALVYSEEEVARLTIFEIVHPEYHDQCRARFRCAKPEKEAPPWEVVFLTKYGRHLYVEGNVSAWILSGQFAGTRGIFRDVTERRLAAIALRNSHRQYESLVNSLDGILWQAELSSLRFTFVSRQAERLLGYPVHLWLHEPNFWSKHIHPADRHVAETILTAGAPGERYRSFEYRMIAADGRIVWLRDTISPPDPNDSRPRLQGIMVDITERKEAEEAVRSIQVKLEQSNATLQRKNEEIQNFYHTLSHELKTPLTSAGEFISIVMDGLAGPLTDTQREYLGIARDSCNQLRVCINDLIDATRVETGKLAIHLQPTSLRSVIQRVVTTMRSAAAEKKITLAQELESDLPDLPLDPNRMTQVITNLLNNAIKYTPPGGEVMIEAGGRAAEPDLIQVSVHDTGCGVPKHEQARIFDRLYQVKTGDATTEQGVGLGLYLCRELVQLHGGRIWVESDTGKGSTFAFVLPKSPGSRPCPSNARVCADTSAVTHESIESETTTRYEKNTNN
jgi:PAS domain S-box-containing protein